MDSLPPVLTDATPDLGDGLTAFRAGPHIFRVDILDWLDWWASYAAPADASPYAHLEAAKQRLAEQVGVTLNRSQIDAFLSEITLEIARVKKKQRDALSSVNSSESTLFS